MTASALLEELHRLGVVLANDGDELVARGPEGWRTPALRSALREHKAELLAAVSVERRHRAGLFHHARKRGFPSVQVSRWTVGGEREWGGFTATAAVEYLREARDRLLDWDRQEAACGLQRPALEPQSGQIQRAYGVLPEIVNDETWEWAKAHCPDLVQAIYDANLAIARAGDVDDLAGMREGAHRLVAFSMALVVAHKSLRVTR